MPSNSPMAAGGRNHDARAGFSPAALLTVVRRRKWLFLGVVSLVMAGFLAASFLLPAKYRSEALVEARPLAVDGLGQDPSELQTGQELAKITEVLHRRSILEPIIRDLDVFPEAGDRITGEELEEMRKRIQVRAEGPRTFTIAFEDPDPRRVAQITSLLTEGLIETTRTEQESRVEARSRFMADQLPDLEAQVAEKKQALDDYRSRWSHEGPDQVDSARTLLEGTQTRLQGLQSEITESEARRTAIQRELAELQSRGLPGGAPESPAERRLEEARVELGRLQGRYTDRHPEVVRAQARVEELERAAGASPPVPASQPEYSPVQLRYVQLEAELEAVRDRLTRTQSERASLLGQAGTYEQRLDAAPRHEATLASLQQDYETTRERYEELLDRYHEAQLAERLQRTREGSLFHLVEAPRVPDSPASPNRLRILLMGLIAALGLGMGTVLLAEQGDSTFRDPDELETFLGVPVLATIPVASGSHRRGPGQENAEPVAMLDDPHGPVAEQYRILATKLTRHTRGSDSTMILVTSPLGGEGKTTTAVNLALALAQMREEGVLLVDTDLGRPAVHRFLGTYLGSGLGALLNRPDEDPKAHVRHLHGLAVLQAGPFAPEMRSALASPRATRAFQHLRQSYPIVVVDSPPVLAVAEGLMLERLVDSVLLVVRASSTPRREVRRAVESLGSSRLIGAVLNGAHESAAPAYPYRYYEPEIRSVADGGAKR